MLSPRRLCLVEQFLSLPLLLFRQLDARAAAPAIGQHQPQSDRNRSAAIGTGTGQHIPVEPDSRGLPAAPLIEADAAADNSFARWPTWTAAWAAPA